MKLKSQILLLATLALLVPILLISTVSIYMLHSGAKEDMKSFRNQEMDN